MSNLLGTIDYELTCPSLSTLLTKVNQNKIRLLILESLGEYKYRIRIFFKDKKKFNDAFKEYRLINYNGFIRYIYFFKNKKFTIVNIIISMFYFYYLSTLLLKINIEGSNENVNSYIQEYLKENDVNIFEFKPSQAKIASLKEDFFLNNLDEIKTFEIYLKGSTLLVSYSLKADEIKLEKKHGKMYSKDDALIDKIMIESGNVLVKENQYVYKNQLIVDDSFYFKDEPRYVGTKGVIYAYTFKHVKLKESTSLDAVEHYTSLLSKARRMVSLYFYDEEKIIKEEILNFKCDSKDASIEILYTLYENIISIN